jgi:hypothetical protein
MFQRQQKPSRGRVAALAVACALGAASLAVAEGRTPAKPQNTRTVVNQVKVTSDGLRVYVDPATGKIKQPTPAEARALDEAIASLPTRDLRSAQVTQHADGSVSITNDGSLMNYAMVRINADGSVSQACIDNAAAADAFLNGAAPAAEEK